MVVLPRCYQLARRSDSPWWPSRLARCVAITRAERPYWTVILPGLHTCVVETETGTASAAVVFVYEPEDVDRLRSRFTETLDAIWHVYEDDELRLILEEEGIDVEDYRKWGRMMGATDPQTAEQIDDARKKERSTFAELLIVDLIEHLHHGDPTFAPNRDHPTSYRKSESGVDVLAYMVRDDSCARCESETRLMVVSVKSSKDGFSSTLITDAASELVPHEARVLALRQQLSYLERKISGDLTQFKRARASALRAVPGSNVMLTPAAVAGPLTTTTLANVVTWLDSRASDVPLPRTLICAIPDFAELVSGTFDDFRSNAD